jgi:hypothetical protein
LHCHVERRDQSFAVAERQNDRIKNIVSVFYSIQCSLNNFELSATIVNVVVGGFTAASTSFLVMNPDFHFVLAMDDIVCTAGPPEA